MNEGMLFNKEIVRKGNCRTLINTIQMETAAGVEHVINALTDKGYDVEKKFIPVSQYDAHVEIKVYAVNN